MAGKSRRVAARQGELSRRRKRAQKGPSGIPAAPARPQPQQNGGGAAAIAVEPAVAAAAAQQAAPAPAASAAAERPADRSRGQTRGPGRPRGERPAAYNYVGAELRRIGILSTAVVAALIVISIVL